MYTGIRILLLIYPFISSFLFLSNFQHRNFLSQFSRELWGLEDWNFVHTWTVGRCMRCTRIRLLLLICPFISSFFFLSNFQHWNFIVTLFLGTVRPRRLKLGTHVNSGQMYGLYQNQAAAAYSSLYFFIFLPLQFSTLKFLVTFFSGMWGLEDWKLVQWADLSCIPESDCCCLFIPLLLFFFFHFSFSPIFNMEIFHHTFLRNCEA